MTDNYVKEEEGTGVVHQAPYFGAVSELLFHVFCGATTALFSYVVYHSIHYDPKNVNIQVSSIFFSRTKHAVIVVMTFRKS